MGSYCSCISRTTVAPSAVRTCTEVELGKYKAMMTQEEALAAEDATRASRVQEWVQALEEIPKEVLDDAFAQQRAYNERLALILDQNRGGSRRVSKEGSSNGNRSPNSRPPDATSPHEDHNLKSTLQQRGSRSKEGMNGLLSCQSEGKQSQDQDIVAQDHASEEGGGGRRSTELQRDGTHREMSSSKRNLKALSSAAQDAAAVVAGQLQQRLVQAGVYEAFMQVRLCMNNGKNLRKEFETIDVDRDQVISMNEFLFACYAMGTGLRRQQIEAIFRVIDENSNGVVEPDEFIAAFQPQPAEGRTTSTDVLYGSMESQDDADARKREMSSDQRPRGGADAAQGLTTPAAEPQPPAAPATAQGTDAAATANSSGLFPPLPGQQNANATPS